MNVSKMEKLSKEELMSLIAEQKQAKSIKMKAYYIKNAECIKAHGRERYIAQKKRMGREISKRTRRD